MLSHVPGNKNPAIDYLSCSEIAPTDRNHLKLTDSIPIHHIEVDLASQITKQDDDKEDFHQDATPLTDSAANPQPATEDVNATLIMFTQRDGGSKDDYEHRLQLIRNHITQHDEDTSSDVAYYTRFVRNRSPHHLAMNQVSSLANREILTAQPNDLIVQRLIHILRDEQLPPSHPNFESHFYKKR